MNHSVELLSAKVPRYTSYPTAPHFHAGIDATVYNSWLSEVPDDAPLSLYLHIPVCDTKIRPDFDGGKSRNLNAMPEQINEKRY